MLKLHPSSHQKDARHHYSSLYSVCIVEISFFSLVCSMFLHRVRLYSARAVFKHQFISLSFISLVMLEITPFSKFYASCCLRVYFHCAYKCACVCMCMHSTHKFTSRKTITIFLFFFLFLSHCSAPNFIRESFT